MENILFLTDAWYPKPSANVVCIKNIISCMKNQNINIICCAFSQDGNTDALVEDNIFIHRILPPKARQLYYRADLEKNPTKAYKLKRKANLFSKLDRLASISNYPLSNKRFAKKWVKQVENLIYKYDITTIISVEAPTESVTVGKILKKKNSNLRWLIYMIDNGAHEEHPLDGSFRYFIKNKLKNIGMKNYLDAMKWADKIYVMEGHKNHYMQNYYKDIHSKIEVVNVPLLYRNDKSYTLNSVMKLDTNGENWVYMGNIGGKYYNPQPLCDFFLNYSKNRNAYLHFWGRGSGVNTIMDYQQISNKRIQFHGLLSHDKVQEVMRAADVLVYLCTEKLEGSVSGKFFEYLTAEKPIIYFAYDMEDINSPYVKRYSNGLIILPELSQSEKEDKIKSFLDKKQYCSYEESKRIFYLNTPEASADAIFKSITSMNEELDNDR